MNDFFFLNGGSHIKESDKVKMHLEILQCKLSNGKNMSGWLLQFLKGSYANSEMPNPNNKGLCTRE